LLATVLLEIYKGIKIPTNPAVGDCQIRGAKALKAENWADLVNDRLCCGLDSRKYRVAVGNGSSADRKLKEFEARLSPGRFIHGQSLNDFLFVSAAPR
jgi:hypothetical protein